MALSKDPDKRARQLANLKRPWKKGETGNRSGRPKGVLAKIEKNARVQFSVTMTKAEKYKVLESMLEMNVDDLKRIVNDSRCPIFMVIIARALVADIRNGKTSTLSECMDRFFGKATQVVEADISGEVRAGGSLDLDRLSLEELKQLRRLHAKAKPDDGSQAP